MEKNTFISLLNIFSIGFKVNLALIITRVVRLLTFLNIIIFIF